MGEPNLNVCPAMLRSGNALVTSRNAVLNELRGASKTFNNLRSRYFEDPASKKLYEESTLALFDFPAGYEEQECRFQFVTDSGDNVSSPMFHDVWSLAQTGGWLSLDTTWTTKHARQKSPCSSPTRPSR